MTFNEDLSSAAIRLMGHIFSWNKGGKLHSITNTYWDYRFESLPNIMNVYPLILGYLNILEKKAENTPPKVLTGWKDFILSSQRRDGGYNNAFGDVAETPSPPIIHIAADLALLRYHEVVGDKACLEAVIKNIDFLSNTARIGGILSNYVVNQNAMLLALLLKLTAITGEGKYNGGFQVENLIDFILLMQHPNGGFYHALHLPYQLSFYNSKIGYALTLAYPFLRDKRIHRAISGLISFMNHLMDDEHCFTAGMVPQETSYSRLKRKIALIKRTPGKFSDFYRDKEFILKHEPTFIARSALGLLFLSKASDLTSQAAVISQKTIFEFVDKFQLPNGAFPNATGFSPNWRNYIPVIRWEAYVFLLLSNFYVGKTAELDYFKNEVEFESEFYRETENSVIDKNIGLEIKKWRK